MIDSITLFMEKALKFFSGKKSTIASILMTLVAYLGAKGILQPDDVVFYGTMVTIIFGASSVATKVMYAQEDKMKGFSKIHNLKK